MEFDELFFETDAGQIISGAHRYIRSAKELRNSDTWNERPTFLQTPTLHLLAHGIELLLKYPLLAKGWATDGVRRKFGHDLLGLWNQDENARLRELLLAESNVAWEAARESNKWQHDDFDKSPSYELVSALNTIGMLHSKESGFALRYIVPPGTRAPRPAFLIDVFVCVAERSVMNPRYPL